MIKNALIALLASAATLIAAPGFAEAEEGKTAIGTEAIPPAKTGHAEVNGVNYYYEIRRRPASRSFFSMAGSARSTCSLPSCRSSRQSGR